MYLGKNILENVLLLNLLTDVPFLMLMLSDRRLLIEKGSSVLLLIFLDFKIKKLLFLVFYTSAPICSIFGCIQKH